MKLKIKWLCLYCDTSFSKKEEVLGHLQNDHDDDGNSPVMYEMKSVLCQSNEKCSSTGLEKNQNGNKGKNKIGLLLCHSHIELRLRFRLS